MCCQPWLQSPTVAVDANSIDKISNNLPDLWTQRVPLFRILYVPYSPLNAHLQAHESQLAAPPLLMHQLGIAGLSWKINLPNCQSFVGFVTGTGIPTVIGSRVPRVRVWFWYLAHRDIPCTRTTVSWVSTGILKQSEHNFYCFETCFFSYLIKFFSFCHTVTQPNMALPAARTSLPLTIKLSPLTPTPILLQNVSHCSTY